MENKTSQSLLGRTMEKVRWMLKNKRQEVRDAALYIIFGVLTTIINVAVYWFCSERCAIRVVPSTIIAWVAAVAFAFLTNKTWVFHSRSWKPGTVLREGAKFFWWRFATGVIDVAGMWLLVDIMHFNGTLMKLLMNVIVIILNYIFSRFLVFKKKA